PTATPIVSTPRPRTDWTNLRVNTPIPARIPYTTFKDAVELDSQEVFNNLDIIFQDLDQLCARLRNERDHAQSSLNDARTALQNKDRQIEELAGERNEFQRACAQSLVNQQSSFGQTFAQTMRTRTAKFEHPDKLDDGVSPEFEHWLSRMEKKLEVNADQYSTEASRIGYIESRTTGKAARHLGPRLRKGHPEQYQTAEEVFTHLKEIYEDPNKLENAKKEFRALIMKNGMNYHDFLTSFLHLAGEAQISKTDIRSEFRSKLSFELQKMVALAYANTTTFQEFQRQCSIAAHTLSDIQSRMPRNSGNRSFKDKGSSNSNSNSSGSTPAKSCSEGLRDMSKIQCYNCMEFG
ncbi:MAG: hypothetical protein ACREHG_05175, partial [Candidatus Saccharimonadales bacterium]